MRIKTQEDPMAKNTILIEPDIKKIEEINKLNIS